MNSSLIPVTTDLVLVGGGHSHVAVLKSFGMEKMPGVRVTLISPNVLTPYSGMLPGLIAGQYELEEAHIDLRPLCQFADAQFLQAKVIGLDLQNKKVLCAGRPPVAFDFLSINVGSTPETAVVPGAAQYAISIKPIDAFLRHWQKVVADALKSARNLVRLVVVGGGAGGVELLLSIRHRLQGRGAASNGPILKFHLVTASPTLLPTHNQRVQKKFSRILRERGVEVHLSHRVTTVELTDLLIEGKDPLPYDILVWVTNASAPEWIRRSGLEVDDQGFIAVSDCLQSVSHPEVFAAGDIATIVNHPRPKSGVFAVREGPPLAANLRRAVRKEPLRPFAPQKNFLSLISTGDQYAVASRGRWAWEGAWVWRLKNWIDRRWMRQYQELPGISMGKESSPAGITSKSSPGTPAAMRCGGCGSKIGSTVLSRVLQRLEVVDRPDIICGLRDPDDAAVTSVPEGTLTVQTVDFFRSFLNDPFVFGQVAAHHSLGDIFAMGAEPQSALALAMIPYGTESQMEEQLFQVMAGAAAVLKQHNAALIGGHTTEGSELVFGLTVNGLAARGNLLRKSGSRPSDRLILTKPIGTGTLFAADMQRKAKGPWIEEAIQSMLLSNAAAAKCFSRHGAHACTDVTGFGLIGHLLEMTRPAQVSAEVYLSSVPILRGAAETVALGILSSLHPQNYHAAASIREASSVRGNVRYLLLFDPQTAGGLLGSVSEEKAGACLEDLREAGYLNAAIIGQVKPRDDDKCPIAIWDRG